MLLSFCEQESINSLQWLRMRRNPFLVDQKAIRSFKCKVNMGNQLTYPTSTRTCLSSQSIKIGEMMISWLPLRIKVIVAPVGNKTNTYRVNNTCDYSSNCFASGRSHQRLLSSLMLLWPPNFSSTCLFNKWLHALQIQTHVEALEAVLVQPGVLMNPNQLLTLDHDKTWCCSQLAFEYVAGSDGMFEEFQYSYSAYFGTTGECSLPKATRLLMRL